VILFGEVCAGVGGMSRGLIAAGMTPRWFVERDRHAAGVLALHHAGVPVHADLNHFYPNPHDHAVVIIAGGTSCQNLSMAGDGTGLDGEQSRVFYQMVRVCKRVRPRFLLWENVPGALSSNEGKDFATILCAFTGTPVGVPEDGWGNAGFVPAAFPSRWNVAWRVLDSQYCGVPQRRRRVFLVGSLGDASCVEILFEPESVRGDNPPSRTAREGATGTLSSRSSGGGGLGTDFELDGGLIAPAITSKWSKGTGGPSGDECQNLVATAFSGRDRGDDGRGYDREPNITGDVSPTLDTVKPPRVAIAFKASHFTRGKDGDPSEIAAPLSADADKGDQDTLIAFNHQAAGKQTTLGASSGTANTLSASTTQAVAYFNDPKTISAEADTIKALCTLRHEVGEEAFCQWANRVIAALRSEAVLHEKVHGGSVRREANNGNLVGDDTPSREKTDSSGAMFNLWDSFRPGRPPSGREPSKQLCDKLTACVPQLPQQAASAARFMRSLWEASEGLGLLREALSALQETWRPSGNEEESTHSRYGVRRLTPIEVERLQSWPDTWTSKRMKLRLVDNLWIPTGEVEEQTDSPRYKQAATA
jgi:site-specific DNA-cytosine methylase